MAISVRKSQNDIKGNSLTQGGFMADISVADAARMTGKPRKSLYRLMDSGKLSFTKDATGKRVIDESELCRVFPEMCQSVSRVNPVSESVEGYKNTVSALTTQLEAALEREKWLRNRLDEVERERAELAHRLLPPGEDAKAPRKSWWRRLFG